MFGGDMAEASMEERRGDDPDEAVRVARLDP
jgi:hypothetical protein